MNESWLATRGDIYDAWLSNQVIIHGDVIKPDPHALHGSLCPYAGNDPLAHLCRPWAANGTPVAWRPCAAADRVGHRSLRRAWHARTSERHVSAMRSRDLYLVFSIQKVSPKCLLLAPSRCQVIHSQNACGGYSRGGHSQKSRRREKLIFMGDSDAATSAPSFSPNGLRSMSAKHAHGSPPSPGAARH